MSDAVPCRLLVEPRPLSGAENMAIDEALLEAALDRGVATVRLYQWSEATLSLGYFQQADDVPREGRLARLPVVRRPSGGGAILHHHEWTYSCALPPGNRYAHDPRELYEAVHGEIVEALRPLGFDLALRGVKDEAADPLAFLCFQRGDPFDVVCAPHKVLGSAQRRRRGAILQHGSLILRRSEFAPEILGLADVAAGTPGDEAIGEAVGQALSALFQQDSWLE